MSKKILIPTTLLVGLMSLSTAQTLTEMEQHSLTLARKFIYGKDQSKFFGRVITSKDLSTLFTATKENPLKDSSNGIYLDLGNKYFVSTAFEAKEVKEGELVETAKTFRLNDKFVFKNVRFKDLTKTEAQKLLEGQTVELKRKTKDGKEYVLEATLIEPNDGMLNTKQKD